MKLSGLQFSNPSLRRLEYTVTDDFDEEKFESLKINFNVDIRRHPSEDRALVGLNLILGENSNDSPVFIDLLMNSEFRWEEQYDPETLDSLLNINAPSLILSYIRPIVALITSSSGMSALHIPFLNFIEEESKEEYV